jgi:hypothetical protein
VRTSNEQSQFETKLLMCQATKEIQIIRLAPHVFQHVHNTCKSERKSKNLWQWSNKQTIVGPIAEINAHM